jgi:hypothetical protein
VDETTTTERALLPEAHHAYPGPTLFAIVSELHGYHETLIAPGIVGAAHSPAGQRAPLGALILHDSPCGTRGVVAAERSERGWEIALDDAARLAPKGFEEKA